jgi:hypothetical protein
VGLKQFGFGRTLVAAAWLSARVSGCGQGLGVVPAFFAVVAKRRFLWIAALRALEADCPPNPGVMSASLGRYRAPCPVAIGVALCKGYNRPMGFPDNLDRAEACPPFTWLP